jgi:hypothetical protein
LRIARPETQTKTLNIMLKDRKVTEKRNIEHDEANLGKLLKTRHIGAKKPKESLSSVENTNKNQSIDPNRNQSKDGNQFHGFKVMAIPSNASKPPGKYLIVTN